jgi:hypothetical protein
MIPDNYNSVGIWDLNSFTNEIESKEIVTDPYTYMIFQIIIFTSPISSIFSYRFSN